MILEALNLSLGNDFWGVNCYWFWRVGSSQMKHATKMILKHQNSNICKWSQKKMILRNDFRIPTPQKKRFTKVGVMKNSWEVKVWPLQLELAVLKCLEVIDLWKSNVGVGNKLENTLRNRIFPHVGHRHNTLVGSGKPCKYWSCHVFIVSH